MNSNEPLKEIPGRVSFGPDHALVTTLQPIVFDAASMSYRAIGEIVGKAWGDGKKFTE